MAYNFRILHNRGHEFKIFGSSASLPYLNEIPTTALSYFFRERKVTDIVGDRDPVVIQKQWISTQAKQRNEAHVTSILKSMKTAGESTSSR
ncbi:hypothetical protein MSHOH_2995 [Methanosarcina horonobensis HB-1 = JCM 15518]|uniref:Uncharacterized protein n=2 Tax=Methanosarcina horonobensis TaxID=418008 RepID=A0A0E3SHW7_9EURY|nr:hypothetical protein [Methanosarcina horonobensis]AKB79478.1 hypothetical protein MSHOH_2995 [Methanosarcina horonobensis HB-1 = JCM 15518]